MLISAEFTRWTLTTQSPPESGFTVYPSLRKSFRTSHVWSPGAHPHRLEIQPRDFSGIRMKRAVLNGSITISQLPDH